MQNIYPLFERNRVLKKELLWALRDYSFTHMQMEYEEYAEGMLSGFHTRVEDGRLIVGKGLVKYKDFIYLVTQEERVAYEVFEEPVSVKMKFYTKQETQDYIIYGMELAVDHDMELKDNEMEICRYRLQDGAELRDMHTCLEDMDTEYNTLNFLSATWGGMRERTMPPVVMRRFARELLGTGNIQSEDMCFAYLCLDQRGTVSMEIIRDYVMRKGKIGTKKADNKDIFRGLCDIVREAGGFRADKGRKKDGRRMILVD